MAWNRKKLLARLGQYLENKKIPFEYDEENLKLKLELFFEKSSYMLYPYVTIDDNLCSININVSEHSFKGFNYECINEFNRKTCFFKAFITEEGIVSLEYRFSINEIDPVIFDSIIDSLYASEILIDAL